MERGRNNFITPIKTQTSSDIFIFFGLGFRAAYIIVPCCNRNQYFKKSDE